MDIFKKMSRDNSYELTVEACTELENLMKYVYKHKCEHFGNARIIRKIFERVEIFQNGRVCKLSDFTKQEIQTITGEDIKCLFDSNEIGRIINEQKVKGNIGFII